MPPAARRFDYEQIALALQAPGATTVGVAKQFGCARATIYKVQQRYELLDPEQSRPRVEPEVLDRRCDDCGQRCGGPLMYCPHCHAAWNRSRQGPNYMVDTITVAGAEYPLAEIALDKLERALDLAHDAMCALNLDPMKVTVVGEQKEVVRKAFLTPRDDFSFDIPAHCGPTLKLGVSMHLQRLEKLKASNEKEKVATGDIEHLMDDARKFADRLGEQLRMAGV